jgi:hypothetical protein
MIALILAVALVEDQGHSNRSVWSVISRSGRHLEFTGRIQLQNYFLYRRLIYEGQHRAHLEASDNLTISPWAALILCEDSFPPTRI